MVTIAEKVNKLIDEGEINHNNLISICDFNEQELEVAKRFWGPKFHITFLVITENMLVKWLGFQKDGLVFTNFLKLLYEKYEAPTHFKIVKYNNGVQILVKGLIWRSMIISSGSKYSLPTLKVHKKMEEVSSVVFNILEQRNLVNEFKRLKNIPL